MAWWQFWRRGARESVGDTLHAVRLSLPGWTEAEQSDEMRAWHNAQGDVLALAVTDPSPLPDRDDTLAVQCWCREAAEASQGGLIEALVPADPYDPTYAGPDRRVMRFMSDDECYDERFPAHPLSIVRRVVSALPQAIRIEPAPGEEP